MVETAGLMEGPAAAEAAAETEATARRAAPMAGPEDREAPAATVAGTPPEGWGVTAGPAARAGKPAPIPAGPARVEWVETAGAGVTTAATERADPAAMRAEEERGATAPQTTRPAVIAAGTGARVAIPAQAAVVRAPAAAGEPAVMAETPPAAGTAVIRGMAGPAGRARPPGRAVPAASLEPDRP